MTAEPLRLVFAGTPDVAVPSLEALAVSHHDVVGVVTREDAPLGRKRVLTASPVGVRAAELGLPVLKANRLRDEQTAAVAEFRPDLGVIVAYGALLRAPMLAVPRLGWVNLHFSLLPRWRGAAPVQHAVIAGDSETGSAVFHLVDELDAGDVYSLERRAIGPDETAGEVLGALAVSGAAQLASVVDALASGTAVAVAQEGEASYAPKLTLADARLNWADSASAVSARLRGVTPEPGAFTELPSDGGDPERLKIHRARIAVGTPRLRPGLIVAEGGRVFAGTATHPLELLSVQPAGRREMPAADWWRGLQRAEGLLAR